MQGDLQMNKNRSGPDTLSRLAAFSGRPTSCDQRTTAPEGGGVLVARPTVPNRKVRGLIPAAARASINHRAPR